MTHRRRFLNTTLTLGALIGAGLLAWSAAGPDRAETIPARPQAVAIDVGVAGLTGEPLPALRVPDLTPQVAPEPPRTGTEVRVPPRPRLVLAVSPVPAYREALPVITPPNLRRPQA